MRSPSRGIRPKSRHGIPPWRQRIPSSLSFRPTLINGPLKYSFTFSFPPITLQIESNSLSDHGFHGSVRTSLCHRIFLYGTRLTNHQFFHLQTPAFSMEIFLPLCVIRKSPHHLFQSLQTADHVYYLTKFFFAKPILYATFYKTFPFSSRPPFLSLIDIGFHKTRIVLISSHFNLNAGDQIVTDFIFTIDTLSEPLPLEVLREKSSNLIPFLQPILIVAKHINTIFAGSVILSFNRDIHNLVPNTYVSVGHLQMPIAVLKACLKFNPPWHGITNWEHFRDATSTSRRIS
jgi:hypothetical protein